MAAPANILQQVATYNESGLALLQNLYCFLSTSNKKFQRFNDDIPKNLGDVVNFDLPPRFNTTNSLVVTFQSAVQRVQPLVVNQQASTAYEFTAQQFIFNVRDYMEVFGRSAIAELGSKIEQYLCGLAESSTFRFYGSASAGAINPITSYLQLANALAFHRNFGSAKEFTKGYLADLTFPQIVNSGLNQFTLDRGNKEAMSWEVGKFSNCDWYQSNLLKVHTAGDVGNEGLTLTVVSSTIDPLTGGVNSITFSGAPASDPNAIKQYDKFQFTDGVTGLTNLRFLTFIGQSVSQSPVQFAAAADAASTAGGDVTVSLTYPLVAGATNATAYSINTAIVPGMEVTVLPNHRCGLIMSGNPLYLAMPKLPEEVPYPTSVQTDPDTGASLRQYFGSLFGQNQHGMVHDVIYGASLVPEYCMMVALPV
jgi:hypothetical protein